MLTSASYEGDDIEHTYKHPSRGLTTEKATEELVACIKELIESEKKNRYNSKKALKDNLLQQHSFVIIITIILLCIAYGLRADRGFAASHLIFEAAFLLVLFSTNIFLDVRNKHLIYSEKVAKATAHLEYFEKNNDPIQVTGIHEPLVTVTHSTVLRDGKWRDIPATFLAKGDLVGLGEGDMTPSRMECVEPGLENVTLEAGQLYTMEQLQILAVRNKDYQPVVQEAHHSNSDETPLPPATPAPAISNATLRESRGHHQERCCFVVLESPILIQLSSAFSSSIRPIDPISYAVAFALKICVRILYFLLGLSIVSIAIRAGLQEHEDLVDLIIIRQTLIVLAMATVLCSNPMLHIINSIANAKLMALFDMLQERSAKGDFSSSLNVNFDAEDQLRVVSNVPYGLFWKYFKILLRGSHPGLVHSVNLVNTLGSTTVFCCVDKDGVLSEPVWPVEEIHLLQENIVSLELSPETENGIPTVHFNDTAWRDYLPVLKPLGLNCLLNRTCCDPVPNTDVRHSTAQDSAKLRFIRAREKAHGVATQCVCQLGKKIGFLDDAFDEFVRLKELHTIAPNRGEDVDHSPYMISLVVKDNSGTLQLLCKGSPDLITSHCSSYWDGEELRVFRAEEQQKINEMYNKIIDKGGHCIAFAYKSVKPIYNTLFEESNYNSPIVDVRVSPVYFVNAASTNTEGYSPSPFFTPKLRPATAETPAADSGDPGAHMQDQGQARGQGQGKFSLLEGPTDHGEAGGNEQEVRRELASDSTPLYEGENDHMVVVGNRETRGEADAGGHDFLHRRRDSGDTSSLSHDTSDSLPPRREKRKGRTRRGRARMEVEEAQEGSLRSSHKIMDKDADEESRDSRRKLKKLQSSQLRFSFTDSPDSSDRDREERDREREREPRKGRRVDGNRRCKRTKGDQDDEVEADDQEERRRYSSGDVKRRVHRKTKRRAEEFDDSSSSSTSEEERGRRRTRRRNDSSSSFDDMHESLEVVVDGRIRKARAARDERKRRRTKRDASRSSSSSSSEISSSSQTSDGKRRRKRTVKKETSKEAVIRGKKKESKKRSDPHSPRRNKDEGSTSERDRERERERASRRHSHSVLEEDKKISNNNSNTNNTNNNNNNNNNNSNNNKSMERKRSTLDVNRRSPQDISVRKEITEDDVSYIESDAGEVTLDKLQADQIFIGMISMRELPKLHTNNFVDVLREAGVRFVLFSSEPRFSCNHFAHKLGLETDWNCCVSLRDPGPNEPHVQDEPSKLPRGISSVRDHLEQVDNVPLLVPLFCDAGPAEKQEMIKILQENGEVVCCVGSALNCSNISIFSQANVSFALEPLLRRCHNRDRDTSDSRPLLTSRLMFEKSPAQTRGPVSTHSLAIDMNSLPCSLVYHRHTDWNEILELLQLSRQMLTNVRHSLLYYAAGCIWLAFVVLLGVVFGLSLNIKSVNTVAGVPLTGLQVVWMTCIILPLFSISLVTCPADPDIMRMLNGKNLPEYRLRGISKFSWYMAIRMAPSILLTTILFLWSVEVIWTSASWGNVFGKDMKDIQTTDYGKALIVAQNVLMFASVYYLALTSASFHSHTTSIINFNPFRNVTWFACTILGIVLQIVFFVISLAVSDSFGEMSDLPWYLYVVLFLWAGGLLFIDELMKKMYRKWFKRFQLELRLEFDTKLGMHSPI